MWAFSGFLRCTTSRFQYKCARAIQSLQAHDTGAIVQQHVIGEETGSGSSDGFPEVTAGKLWSADLCQLSALRYKVMTTSTVEPLGQVAYLL